MSFSSPIAGPPLTKGGIATCPDAESQREFWQSAEVSDDFSVFDRTPPSLELDALSVAVDAAIVEYFRRLDANEAIALQEFLTGYPLAVQAEMRRIFPSLELLRSLRFPNEEPPKIPWPKPGEIIDGLEVRQVLGCGGLARVYLVWDANLNRHDVLKVARHSAAEGHLAGPLAHPNIIPIQSARTFPNGVSWIRMPLAGCATLGGVLTEVFPSIGTIPKSADIFRAVGRRRAEKYEIPTPAIPTPHDDRPYLEGALALATELARGVAFLHQHDIRHG